jgi:hypothetical protein
VTPLPDSYGFTHEPHRGVVYHRCTECDDYPWGVNVPEKERRRHHEKHEKARLRQADHNRRSNLAMARRIKAQAERENRSAYDG